MTNRIVRPLVFAGLFLTLSITVLGQQSLGQTQTDEDTAAQAAAPPDSISRLVRYSAVLDRATNLPLPSVVGITFSLYDARLGGTALWMESQNVSVDSEGHYSAILGVATPGGVPQELFASGQARWLGVQIAAQNETRVPLLSVPYAMQAGDSQSLGGKSALEYVLGSQIEERIQKQVRMELQLAGVELASSDKGSSPSSTASTASPGDGAAPAGPTLTSAQGLTVVEMPAFLVEMDRKLNQVTADVSSIKSTVETPPEVFSYQLCTEPAGNFEVAGKADMKLNGSVVGKVGADVYGNGGVLLLRAKPESGVDTGVKFGWDFLKLGICADLRAAVQRLSTLTADTSGWTASLGAHTAVLGDSAVAASPDGGVVGAPAQAANDLLHQVANINEDALLAKMLGTANNLQMDPAKLQVLLDRVSTLTFDGSPLSILQGNSDRAALMDALPMPVGVRSVLSNPADLLGKLKDLLDSGICNLSSQAPALDPLLQPVCALAANERYAKLLDRVDDVTGNIQSKVTAVSNKVQDILDQLPVAGDCRLFCN